MVTILFQGYLLLVKSQRLITQAAGSKFVVAEWKSITGKGRGKVWLDPWNEKSRRRNVTMRKWPFSSISYLTGSLKLTKAAETLVSLLFSYCQPSPVCVRFWKTAAANPMKVWSLLHSGSLHIWVLNRCLSSVYSGMRHEAFLLLWLNAWKIPLSKICK